MQNYGIYNQKVKNKILKIADCQFNFLISLTYVVVEYIFNISININMTMLSDPNFNLEFNQNETFNIIEL